jgi:hypothetical protein
MEPEAQDDSSGPLRPAIEDLCQLIDAIDQTTDLLERHSLYRSLYAIAEMLGVRRTERVSSAD